MEGDLPFVRRWFAPFPPDAGSGAHGLLVAPSARIVVWPEPREEDSITAERR